MAIELRFALEQATAAARTAGELLRADLHRPGGPRGRADKAEADTEAERLVRGSLLGAFPGWGFLGEETGHVCGRAGQPLWLVDPNDGTRDYLKGRRGSAVSIALLVDSLPRVGVVFAFASPDDRGDLFTWAEGCGPLLRNGGPVAAPSSEGLGPLDVVLVSSAGDSDPTGNLACVTPARFRAVPSIAHRLALVAAGEAAAAVSLNWPTAWDYAAGHALLRGAGGTLLDEQGREVAYGVGQSHCVCTFGGREEVIRDLPSRPWRTLRMTADESEGDDFPVRLEKGQTVADAGRLARAQGCLLGQVAGDSLGGLVEFDTASEVRRRHGDGPRRLVDGGHWDILAGQPTDDSEMALALARSIVARGGYEREAAGRAYRAWLRSSPFDVGLTVGRALRDRPDRASQANGSLMRASPLGVCAHAMAPAVAAELGRQDSSLTHPNPACGDATAAFVVAVAHAIREGDGPEGAYHAAERWARGAGAALLVREAIEAAWHEAPRCDTRGSEGWVKIALQNAFHELLRAPSLEEGVVATVRRGGDTDTNAAITGALLGAVHGREAVPAQWRSMVLSCRPLPPRARRPRPHECWPVDVPEIAERLLLRGERGGTPPARD
jgi:ADP-ribosylglycohydrolase/fructose-1,6-bisphosphatase/inositol monophosphatase family enzyme